MTVQNYDPIAIGDEINLAWNAAPLLQNEATGGSDTISSVNITVTPDGLNISNQAFANTGVVTFTVDATSASAIKYTILFDVVGQSGQIWNRAATVSVKAAGSI